MNYSNTHTGAVVTQARSLLAAVDALLPLAEPRHADRVRERMVALENALAELGRVDYDVKAFTPLNGRCAVERVSSNINVWRVLAIADNWPQPHHPLHVGDLIVPAGYAYSGIQVGNVAWLKPTDILAIRRDGSTPVAEPGTDN